MTRPVRPSLFAALYAPPGTPVTAPRERKPRAKQGHPERDVQRTLIAYMRQVIPGCIVAAVTNEERGRGKTEIERARFGAARKVSGVLTGQPDLIAYLSGGRTLLIEVKAPGRTLSDAQAELHQRLRALGHQVITAASVEQLRAGLLAAGISTREAA